MSALPAHRRRRLERIRDGCPSDGAVRIDSTLPAGGSTPVGGRARKMFHFFRLRARRFRRRLQADTTAAFVDRPDSEHAAVVRGRRSRRARVESAERSDKRPLLERSDTTRSDLWAL